MPSPFIDFDREDYATTHSQELFDHETDDDEDDDDR
jgi:hypothetical protein